MHRNFGAQLFFFLKYWLHSASSLKRSLAGGRGGERELDVEKIVDVRKFANRPRCEFVCFSINFFVSDDKNGNVSSKRKFVFKLPNQFSLSPSPSAVEH